MNLTSLVATLAGATGVQHTLVVALDGETSEETLARVYPGRAFDGHTLVIHRDMKPVPVGTQPSDNVDQASTPAPPLAPRFMPSLPWCAPAVTGIAIESRPGQFGRLPKDGPVWTAHQWYLAQQAAAVPSQADDYPTFTDA
jgi:hypothetical protein